MPALVLCDRQTRGRGRGSNRWWAAEGALTFSLLLRQVSVSSVAGNWTCVSLATGVAVCRLVDPMLPVGLRPCRLRWPNDVYVANRKLSGILVEAILPVGVNAAPETAANGDRCLVVGVGINVNNSTATAPPDVRERAVALCELLGYPVPLTDVLTAFLAEFRRVLKELECSPEVVAREWQERCDLSGQWVRLTTAGGLIRGLCCGISPSGELLLRTEKDTIALTTGWDLQPESRF